MLDGTPRSRASHHHHLHHHRHGQHDRLRHFLEVLVILPCCIYLGVRGVRWLRSSEVRRHKDGMQASEEEAGMLFGLTQDGKVFFRPDAKDTAFVQLRGEPCGGVWGQPIDVDASSRAIWVVCEKEYMTSKGAQTEHFLFAKWGWSTANNHVWWHMMRGGNVVQLDADDDAMWGLDGSGAILWRPAGDVGKHSTWLRVDGPPDVTFTLIAADNNEDGTWLWLIDDENRVWRRSPGDYHMPNTHSKWTHKDNDGHEFWTKPDGSILKDLKANQGFAMGVDDRGNLLKRSIDGSCCVDGNVSPVKCWCVEPMAPRLSAVTDNGDQGLGFYFPSLQQKHETGSWVASANRWLELLTSRDDGHNADSPHEASQYFSYHCKPQEVDHCAALDESITDFLSGWQKVSRQTWSTWDWGKLKDEYGHCSGSSRVCQRPLKHYGAFRERFMQNLFCCSRHLQTQEDPSCETPICKAYDMTCPGSRLLTSDLDCTVYHSRDPGTLIQNMSLLAAERLAEHVGEEKPDLSVLFDVSLYGTWTWIPDEVFRRFDWPASSKSLFERVEGKEGAAVWVFRRKCTATAREAIRDKVKRMIHVGAEDITSENLDQLTVALQRFVGNLAEGNYGNGRHLRDWDRLYQDFRAVSSVQREGYLTYAATLEVVGRQQVGLPTTFAEDYQCMRQVSFLEQLAFIAQHIQVDVPEDISESTFNNDIAAMLLKSGKYFDRLLEVDGPGYDEGRTARRRDKTLVDNSVLWRVLETVYGSNHLGTVMNGMCSWDPASSLSMTTSAFDDAEVRRRSCMDIATWGNAVRHMDAFRRDTGDLIRPMVQALFTCLVHPNATTEGTMTAKEAMLHAIDVWTDAIPPLEEATLDFGLSRLVYILGLAALGLTAGAVTMVRRRHRAKARLEAGAIKGGAKFA